MLQTLGLLATCPTLVSFLGSDVNESVLRLPPCGAQTNLHLLEASDYSASPLNSRTDPGVQLPELAS